MTPRVLCITGGMGAGKSLAVSYFRDLDWPVYPADERAKFLITTSPRLQYDLVSAFGSDSICPDGSPNAVYLGIHAFSSHSNWQRLNEIIHPAVNEDFIGWLGALKAQDHPWVIKESALLFEIGNRSTCNRVLLITAQEALRKNRIAQRNPELSLEALSSRMSFQWDDDRKRKLLGTDDFEISNDDSSENFLRKIALWSHAAFANVRLP